MVLTFVGVHPLVESPKWNSSGAEGNVPTIVVFVERAVLFSVLGIMFLASSSK
ncbi:hypothetical protein [Riemerella anatipestifer]|uniref:hypothetical protein n=1 Tax=Riemerella anatipestifer TaxID=34085 RepID=UPI001626D288|nr:hypothetical protein [Riemerella anatipestifer]